MTQSTHTINFLWPIATLFVARLQKNRSVSSLPFQISIIWYSHIYTYTPTHNNYHMYGRNLYRNIFYYRFNDICHQRAFMGQYHFVIGSRNRSAFNTIIHIFLIEEECKPDFSLVSFLKLSCSTSGYKYEKIKSAAYQWVWISNGIIRTNNIHD